MNLGEKIYSLRTIKNLSQGDLADMLGVSRQSVSKWENNSALPDLEKIIKLSEIFEISIDELVKGEKADNTEAKETQSKASKIEYVYIQQPKPPLSGSKIAGIVMFGIAFIMFVGILFATGSIGGLFYAIPFAILGIICFAVRENTGLWCSWAAYIMGDIFMRYATGLSPATILHTLRWSYDMNYARLAISWVWFIILVLLIFYTVKCVKDKPLQNTQRHKKLLVAGWTLYTAEKIIVRILVITGIYEAMIEGTGIRAFAVLNNFTSLIKTLLLAVLISQTVRYLKNKKQ